jgi:hypothetical protein
MLCLISQEGASGVGHAWLVWRGWGSPAVVHLLMTQHAFAVGLLQYHGVSLLRVAACKLDYLLPLRAGPPRIA